MNDALTTRAAATSGPGGPARRSGARRGPAAVAASLVLVGMALAPAVGAAPLSLDEAVRTALAHSPMVEESRAHAATARSGRTQVRGMGLPAIEIREVALRTDSPADAFGLQLMQERFSFPEFTQSDPNSPEPINNFATEFQATMPLFTGGKLSAARRGAGQMVDATEAM